MTHDGRWGNLTEWAAPVGEGKSPVASGVFVRLAEDRVAVSQAGQQVGSHLHSQEGAISAHPDSAMRANLTSTGNDQGCCGSSGLDGPNRACICGNVVATEWSDCWTQSEIRFLPDAIIVQD